MFYVRLLGVYRWLRVQRRLEAQVDLDLDMAFLLEGAEGLSRERRSRNLNAHHVLNLTLKEFQLEYIVVVVVVTNLPVVRTIQRGAINGQLQVCFLWR